MLMGAVAGFATAVSTGNAWLGLVAGDAGRRRSQPAPRGRDDPPPGRPGRVGPRADVPRHRPRAGPRRGPVERRRDRPAPVASRSRSSRASRSSGRSSSTTRASWSTSATCSCRSPGSGSTAPGRDSTCGRSASTRPPPTPRASSVYRTALRLRVRRRTARGPRRRDDHARGLAGLVQRADDERPRLDRVGLVIFAQWSPLRAAFGAYLFGTISRFILDVQGERHGPGRRPTRSSRDGRRRSSSRCCPTCS